MTEPVFAPIVDRTHFPLLTSGDELPCAHLVGCMDLVFFAPAELAATYPLVAQEGRQWHLYGDTRWPARAAWIEFDTSKIGYLNGRIPGQSSSYANQLIIHSKSSHLPPFLGSYTQRHK